jgi:fucokinase
VVTAGSSNQAERYADEIQRRRERGTLPAAVPFLVVPDPEGARLGSGGATLNALRALQAAGFRDSSAGRLQEWWEGQRVLIVHSGGEARRLPQYSLKGKLFTVLPVKTAWGETSTAFDELLAFSTLWVERLRAGLLVTSGDVILTFDATPLNWDRPGVCGVAMPLPVNVASRHGVYVIGEAGRVYCFLQKPTSTQISDAGGMLSGERAALDIGLLRFDARVAAALCEVAGLPPVNGHRNSGETTRTAQENLPFLDLYEHVTMALTGQWTPTAEAPAVLHRLAGFLQGQPFWCDLVEGDFVHIGTTKLFRQLMTGETDFLPYAEGQGRPEATSLPGLHSAGVIIDSVFNGGGEIGLGAVVIECDLSVPVELARGSILHGVVDVASPVKVPEDTVVHQVPVAAPGGARGVVMRVFGVSDDPKANVPAATWFGRPLLEVLAALGVEAEEVWPGIDAASRSLWNARLFPVGNSDQAWACARWMMGTGEGFPVEQWRRLERLSLATSAEWVDNQAMADLRARRMYGNWQMAAISLAQSGSDLRPLLAHAPGLRPLATSGQALCLQGAAAETAAPTQAASLYVQASLFLQQAGLAEEAGRAANAAFECVQRAVEMGVKTEGQTFTAQSWRHQAVTVSAPARVDMGGGWSDTPPFCLDWGGTVLNVAVLLNGEYPIHTTIRRLAEPVLRCVSEDSLEQVEYCMADDLQAVTLTTGAFNIHRKALQMMGVATPGQPLAARLKAMGGGLEIRTAVNLPLGSGLGTSSILGATVIRALAEMSGITLSDAALLDQVMQLEQHMTTGGGWQDQVGGVFPGAKLGMSGPGLRQRIRVEPLGWSAEREAEFKDRFILYYTGIQRLAKNLLAQIVRSYLAREVSTIQVLHSIKTLATEMAYAMREGDLGYLGELLDRHWCLNQILDPHTTNAPIKALLREMQPWLAGAKLAGAGGGGFLMLLAKSREAAQALRARLASGDLPGKLHEYAIAQQGLRVVVE